MKRNVILILFLMLSATAFSQKTKPLNVLINYSAAFGAEKAGNCSSGNEKADVTTGFCNKAFRIEVKGDISERLFYRFRHRLNKCSKACEDDFAKATDIAMIGYHANEKLTLQVGKMTLIWGGYEYDLAPHEVYQFSDMNEIIENYTPGIIATWEPMKQQQFAMEVANSSCYTFEEQFPWTANDITVKPSNHPFTYIAGWNGSLWGGLVTTRWAVGYVTTAKGKGSKAITLGQRLQNGKFKVYLDYMGSFDDIDRLGIVAGETGNKVFTNIKYNSFIARADYRLAPRWNVFMKGFYETSSAPDAMALKNYRTGLGYYAGIEYRPVKSQNLLFSLSYQGRHFSYKDAAKTEYGFRDYDNIRIELGMMYYIKCF